MWPDPGTIGEHGDDLLALPRIIVCGAGSLKWPMWSYYEICEIRSWRRSASQAWQEGRAPLAPEDPAGKGFRVVGDLADADRIMNNAIFIGTCPGLRTEHLDYMVATIQAAFGVAS